MYYKRMFFPPLNKKALQGYLYQKELLLENNVNRKKFIYVDLDGVLVDLNSGIMNLGYKPTSENYNKKELWELIESIPDFWKNLPPTPDAFELWNYIKSNNPVIISSPIEDINCYIGKQKWVFNHLGNHVTVILEKQKYIYAWPDRILIDDRETVIKPWVNSGGIGILHESAKSTILKLKEFGL